ncbi:Hsp20/alpha crystallin family protein [Mesonia sp. K7]|uniref:Hsp20/alpha crystallin family protein n=1 Tax=Mesonia sp. K7 TaxID=2218606 RepID=UPI000DA8C0A4|nr:Hsp20/alpha crystallin family protein [Mesonia sp. K7]PZD76932.1 Hsp20/alpha crystallin family protein [Mesonia sp. K7]
MSLVKRTDNWLPSIFDDMFKTDWLGGTSTVNNIGVTIPAVNISENENSFKVEVAAPGKNKEDFHIELEKDVLTISAEAKDEKVEEKSNYTRKEFNYHTFKRAFSLPDMVDSQKITAAYENGVLKIEIPKKEEAKEQTKRMIEIL